jgi:anthraniloyl-CoA monooxygenase
VKQIDIVAAGPAGLYAALLLRSRYPHLSVRVHERRARGDSAGLGIILYGETLADFLARDAQLGQLVRAQVRPIDSISVRHRLCWTHVPECNLSSVARQALLDSLIERCLAVGVNIVWRAPVHSLETLAGSDLVIVANGARSNLRETAASYFGVRKTECQNHYLWMYIDRAVDGFVFDFQRCGDRYDDIAVLHSYPFTPNASSVIVEMPAMAAKELSVRNSAQPRAVAAELSVLFADALRGSELRLFDERSSLAFERFVTVRCDNWIMPQRQSQPRAVLMGDAARTAHFSIGSGTRLALADAATFVDTFPDLSAYTQQRMQASLRVQQKAQLSMDWFSNVSRYMDLGAQQFTQALLNRTNGSTRDNTADAVLAHSEEGSCH